MSAGRVFQREFLDHLLRNADVANIGDASGLQGSATAGNLYLSLHTADPGETGNQTTNEVVYSAYARVATSRDTGGTPDWGAATDASPSVSSLQNEKSFPEKTDGGSETATHFGIGTASSGSGKLIASGAISPNIVINQNTTPKLDTGTQVTLD